ncbi:MAG TPA: M14 family metallopeptidase, partial [Acidobacteriota bacterium]|nr:M14 family metallopeptidase [Acidobacteriota bacterium]
LLSSLSEAREKYQLVQIEIPDRFTWQELAQLGIALEEGIRFHEGKVDLILNTDEVKRIQESGFRFLVLRSDMESFFRGRLSARAEDDFARGSMGGFHTFTEALKVLQDFRRNYKELISAPIEIGRSIEGHPIFAFRISDNADVNENEPEVLYTALHHAREPQSLMTLLYFMEKLLQGYGKNQEITFLIDNRQLWFIPVVNPDGYIYNEEVSPAGGGLWRKNRRRNSDGSLGVDLNRNYSFKWGYDNFGSSPRTADETYRGTGAFSEPETTAIRDFVKSRKFVLNLNYHSYRDFLIYPWGYKDEETPHAQVFKEYATWMTRINRYGLGTSFQTLGYLTNGEADDWFYGDLNRKNRVLSMTPEVGGFEENFWPSPNRIKPLAQENFQANLALAWLAGGYIVTKQTRVKGLIQPGEPTNIYITLRNMGYREKVSNISVKLRTLSRGVAVTSPNANYGTLKPFQNTERNFRIVFASLGNIPQPVQFEVLISSNGTVLRKDNLSLKLQR